MAAGVLCRLPGQTRLIMGELLPSSTVDNFYNTNMIDGNQVSTDLTAQRYPPPSWSTWPPGGQVAPADDIEAMCHSKDIFAVTYCSTLQPTSCSTVICFSP
eukprot:GFUD01043261.1.p1 GENE.GFUD01043261.1~~GFUD01043261.1.p1  ORF type:complete len:101 (-),score=12.55 GFUD01043261.1:46-348(-)